MSINIHNKFSLIVALFLISLFFQNSQQLIVASGDVNEVNIKDKDVIDFAYISHEPKFYTR
jgi:hypothetical protein